MELEQRMCELKATELSSLIIHCIKQHSTTSCLYRVKSAAPIAVLTSMYLVSTPATGRLDTSNTLKNTLVSAVQTTEYAVNNTLLLHVNYIDSMDQAKTVLLNGAYTSPLRHLVQSIIQLASAKATAEGRDFRVHVFAKPAPHYIFNKKQSKSLNASELSLWWLKTLSLSGFDRRYISNTDLSIKAKSTASDASCGQWTQGLVYEGLDECPVLTDDAVGRGLKYLEGDCNVAKGATKEAGVSARYEAIAECMKAFIERMKLSCDFKDGEALFTLRKCAFAVSEPVNTSEYKVCEVNAAGANGIGCALDKIVALLEELDFSDSNRHVSSEKFYTAISKECKVMHVKLEKGDVVVKEIKKPVVLNIGGLVKRKSTAPAKVDVKKRI